MNDDPNQLPDDPDDLGDLRQRIDRRKGPLTEAEMNQLWFDHKRRHEHEDRSHWRWLGTATRNLLTLLAAIGAFVMVCIDAVGRLLSGAPR